MKRSDNLASRLNKRITLQEEVKTPDGAGGYSLSWRDIATVWAEIKPLSANKGDEAFVSMQQEGRSYAIITIRHREDVTHKLRILYGLRLFNIISVTNPDEANVYLELLVAEGVAI